MIIAKEVGVYSCFVKLTNLFCGFDMIIAEEVGVYSYSMKNNQPFSMDLRKMVG